MIKKLLSVIVFALAVVSCTTDNENNFSNEQTNSFNVTNDAAALQSSVDINGAGVLGVTTISTNRSNEKNPEDLPVLNIGIVQIAMVDPPSLNGMGIRANHVDVHENFAYVAYTKEGAEYLGGIDIIDISDKYQPKVITRMTTSNADINALYYKDNKIYFTGAANSNLDNRAIMGVVSTSNGEFTSDFEIKSIAGHAGVDILPFNNKTMVVTGSNGSIGVYNSESLALENEVFYNDLRSAAFSNGKLVALSGTSGILNLNTNTLENESIISISNLLAESKRTISFQGEDLMVAEGGNGVGIYNVSAGSFLTRLPINALPGLQINPSEKVTNAVSFAEGFVLMSNGSAGFGLSKLNNQNILIEEGIVEILGSSNYIKSVGDYIFVAAGTGGVRILKISKPEATVNSGIFANCDTYEVYNGGKTLVNNPNEEEFYSGTATVNSVVVNNKLTFCGTLNVENQVNVNSNSVFKMNGALAVGVQDENSHVNINSNATLQIQGDLTIYGDLTLNRDSTLEFIGENSTVHVYGNVSIHSDAKVIGNYTDTSNKL